MKNICIKCGVDLYATEGKFECQKHPKECKGIYLSKEDLLIHEAEQKQHLINMIKADEELGLYEEETKCYCSHTTYCDCIPLEVKIDILDFNQIVKEPKQETTPEEVAEYLGFVKGAKWQQEQDKNKYSEEEVYNLTQQLRLKLKSGVLKWQDDFEFDLDKWFEQFKKK